MILRIILRSSIWTRGNPPSAQDYPLDNPWALDSPQDHPEVFYLDPLHSRIILWIILGPWMILWIILVTLDETLNILGLSKDRPGSSKISQYHHTMQIGNLYFVEDSPWIIQMILLFFVQFADDPWKLRIVQGSSTGTKIEDLNFFGKKT